MAGVRPLRAGGEGGEDCVLPQHPGPGQRQRHGSGDWVRHTRSASSSMTGYAPNEETTQRCRDSGADRREGRKHKRSSSRAPPAGGVKRPAYSRTEIDDMEIAKSRTGRSRREWLRRDSILRRRSESCPPSATRVHREEDEHTSMGRVSLKSAKKGGISDLLYDVV